MPVKWHIIASDCEPILAGNSATALGIIGFNQKQGILAPINMIDNDLQGKIHSCLAEYPHNFKGVGKLKNYPVKLHINTKTKPLATSPRSIPYHLRDQVSGVIQDMINQDIIEEHSKNQPAP